MSNQNTIAEKVRFVCTWDVHRAVRGTDACLWNRRPCCLLWLSNWTECATWCFHISRTVPEFNALTSKLMKSTFILTIKKVVQWCNNEDCCLSGVKSGSHKLVLYILSLDTCKWTEHAFFLCSPSPPAHIVNSVSQLPFICSIFSLAEVLIRFMVHSQGFMVQLSLYRFNISNKTWQEVSHLYVVNVQNAFTWNARSLSHFKILNVQSLNMLCDRVTAAMKELLGDHFWWCQSIPFNICAYPIIMQWKRQKDKWHANY